MTASITRTFEGRDLTIRSWKGRPAVVAQEFGATLGYAQPRKLVAQVRGAWRGEFEEGVEYDVLTGEELAAWNDYTDPVQSKNPGEILDCTDPVQSRNALPQRGARSLVILYEPGMNAAALLSKTPGSARLRRWLAREVLPAIRATGQYARPPAPVLRMVPPAPASPAPEPLALPEPASAAERAARQSRLRKMLRDQARATVERAVLSVVRPGFHSTDDVRLVVQHLTRLHARWRLDEHSLAPVARAMLNDAAQYRIHYGWTYVYVFAMDTVLDLASAHAATHADDVRFDPPPRPPEDDPGSDPTRH